MFNLRIAVVAGQDVEADAKMEKLCRYSLLIEALKLEGCGSLRILSKSWCLDVTHGTLVWASSLFAQVEQKRQFSAGPEDNNVLTSPCKVFAATRDVSFPVADITVKNCPQRRAF